MGDRMMAAVLYGQEQIQIESVEIPQLGPGDLLVRVRVALTCGTDVKVFRRGYHARMIVPPALFGHELAGDVVAVGRDVTAFRPGDRIVAANSAPCGVCHYCRSGKSNLCDDLLFNNGAYAEYIRIPARIVEANTHKFPHAITYSDAALTEPLACALKAIEDTDPQPGDTLTVIGLGPLGTMLVKLAKLAGTRVIAVARKTTQVERALRMGADEGVATDCTPDAVERVLALTGGAGSEIVIEAVGKPETWNSAVTMLRRGGTVNFFGGCPADTTVSLDTNLLHYSELTCKASFHHTPAHIRRALDVIIAGHVTARDFVNHEEPLANLPRVMQHLAHHNGALKTAILP